MKRTNHPCGFSLVEVTLALGVAGFCLIAIFGLLPLGISSNQAATEQIAAANLLTAVVTDLRATANVPPKGSAQTSPAFGIALPAPGTPETLTTSFLSADGRRVSSASDARYQLNVWITPPATGRTATAARLLITWPAPANVGKALGSVETFTALDRN
jgi:uncharacterized protein (TIGR02598 family)